MAASNENRPPASASGFDSRGVGLRVQKKLASRFIGSRRAVRNVVDDSTAHLLDNVYRLAKAFSGSKREAEKVAKNVVKIVVKIALLGRNDQFSPTELALAAQLKTRFRSLCMTVVSFHRVSFSYERSFLLRAIEDLRDLLQRLVGRHLSEKSRDRIDFVCRFFSQAALLDQCFQTPVRGGGDAANSHGAANTASDGAAEASEDAASPAQFAAVMNQLVDDLDRLLESGIL